MAERLVSTVLPMGTIAGPGSHLPINRCDRPKRFRSWLSRSEPIPTIRNAASGHAKKYAPTEDRSRDFFLSGRISQGRSPACSWPSGKNKAQGTPEPKPAAHFPEHSKQWIFGILGLVIAHPQSIFRSYIRAGLCRPTGTQLRSCPRNLAPARIRSVTSRPFASLERLQRLRP